MVCSNGDVKLEVVTSGIVGVTKSCFVDTDDRDDEVHESVLVVEDADEEDNKLETVDDSTFNAGDVATDVDKSDVVVGDVEGTASDMDMTVTSEIQRFLFFNYS